MRPTVHDMQRHKHGRPPVANVDVYVDNFLLSMALTASQNGRALRHTLSSIDDDLRPFEKGDPACQKEHASIKEMHTPLGAQGHVFWVGIWIRRPEPCYCRRTAGSSAIMNCWNTSTLPANKSPWPFGIKC